MAKLEHMAGSIRVYGVHCGGCSALLGYSLAERPETEGVKCKTCIEGEVYDEQYSEGPRGKIIRSLTPKHP